MRYLWRRGQGEVLSPISITCKPQSLRNPSLPLYRRQIKQEQQDGRRHALEWCLHAHIWHLCSGAVLALPAHTHPFALHTCLPHTGRAKGRRAGSCGSSPLWQQAWDSGGGVCVLAIPLTLFSFPVLLHFPSSAKTFSRLLTRPDSMCETWWADSGCFWGNKQWWLFLPIIGSQREETWASQAFYYCSTIDLYSPSLLIFPLCIYVCVNVCLTEGLNMTWCPISWEKYQAVVGSLVTLWAWLAVEYFCVFSGRLYGMLS